ncbi:ABC transporter substrate-binding protein, partial [Pseudorhodoplanes sp.]|uniref:ABC transporter substrate-binding protein n=1 Tax=Pseudorhodoplanes sp. TaxID=1934341 RepID=UPI002C5E979D
MLSVAIGDYPHTRLLKERLASSPDFNFVDVSPITKAFAQMVRQGTYDISEMALVTFLQAKAFGKPLVLIPAAVAARSQEISLIKLAKNDAIRGPADLRGKRIGVRAYSQTTGAWLRGILAENFGIAPETVHWTTFEDPHVAEYSDPPFATRAKPGSVLLDMLRAGELDAVIVGNDKPTDSDLADVYPDAGGAGREFARKHGFVPVNHVIVAKQSVVDQHRDVLMAFWSAVKDAWKDT